MELSVNSKYKFFGGFGLLAGFNAFIVFGIFKLLTASKISVNNVDLINDKGARAVYLIIFSIFFLFLLLLVTQCKRITIDRDGITFINLLLPFLKTNYCWADFDYYIRVDEYSRYSTYEAIWLIKNKKIERRISSYYYSNYFDLLKQIKSKNKGKKSFGPLAQLFSILKLKRIHD